MKRKLLVAGIGNIFLGDDGFGVAVAERLAREILPGWVRVTDFGIRGLHLAYELLDGAYDTTILLDAAPRRQRPGTVYLIEPQFEKLDGDEQPPFDAHGMDPRGVFALLQSLGGVPGRVVVVGCEPLQTNEGIGLSPPVAAAVEEALKLVREVIENLSRGLEIYPRSRSAAV